MPIDPSSPVEQLAASGLAAVRHLCRLGIDVLDPGDLTLQEACDGLGLSAEKVAAELRSLAPIPQKDWAKASTPELVHHIVLHHHAFTRDELARVQKLIEKLLEGPTASQALLVKIQGHVASLSRDLLAHFQMEERNLFPALCAAENGGVTPISLSTPSEQARTIAAEHQAVEELFHNVRLLTGDYALPPDASPELRSILLGLRNLEDDLHLHLFVENHILFPRALPL